MNNATRRKLTALGLAVAAGSLLVVSLAQPLWRLRMEAPQYRDKEALKVIVYPHALRGDVNEIKVLNKYIGVHIPEHLPQLGWLPLALLAAAGLGLAVPFLPRHIRRGAGLAVPALLAIALVGAAVQAQLQMYRIGHNRTKSELLGVKDFTPPFLGKTKIAQFEVSSGFGLGAYLIGAAMLLQAGGALAGAGWRRRSCASTPGRPQPNSSAGALGRSWREEHEAHALGYSRTAKGHAR